MIQDRLFALGSVVFILGLIPMVRAKQPPPLKSSLSTGLVLAVYVGCQATLGLWYAAVTTAVTSALWLWLAGQRLRGS